MSALKYDLTRCSGNDPIEQGADFTLPTIYTDNANSPVDLTGWTARGQGRISYQSASAIFTITTENSGISLGGTAGTVLIHIPAATTAQLPAIEGVYDVELIDPDGVVYRYLEGQFEITPEATKL